MGIIYSFCEQIIYFIVIYIKNNNLRVRRVSWMKPQLQFKNKILDGQKGKIMLQISKTFKGDNRFKLDQRFQNDVDVQKLPQKFKKTLENDLMQRVKQKTKHIKKQQPQLIVRRFQPGTQVAQQIIKKAEGKKKYLQGVFKAQKKKLQKINKIQKGINKIKKANQLLQKPEEKSLPKFQLEVKGDKKDAFKPSHFKLFQ